MLPVWLRRTAAFVVMALVAAIGAPALADTGDARAERERVRRERAAVAADLDVLRAESAEVDEALAAMNARVAHEEAALASAEQAVNVARQAATDAATREAATAAEIDRLEAAMRDAAVDEFIRGGSSDLESLIDAETADLRAIASMKVLQATVTSSAADAADALEAAREDFDVARQRAEEAAVAAEQARAAVEERLGQVRDARAQQSSFASQLDQRIESRLAEAANLQALDSELAARIVREQAALASRTAGVARSPIRSGGTRGNVPLATVRGITVHADIADELQAMLEAADADRLSFGGGGYRDSEQQQRLREQNCPDPERSPASSCRPPTARPGQSMHEQGLAIDFTLNGRLITSRSNPGYRWLAQNAGRFGLRNLPEEPWHWSTNGR